ncbi:MAG: sulfotransferase domain-containing protein [bacterium]
MESPSPDFILIGGQKCGTSSLFFHLKNHPGIYEPDNKEINYFTDKYARPAQWYRDYFTSDPDLLNFEATTYYLFHPLAPKRIKQDLPNCKFIVLLRNPVDRTQSHYHHNIRNDREELPFPEAIKKESERIKGEVERIIKEDHYVSFSHRHYSYLTRSLYVKSLSNWLEFFPRERFLIIQSEEFFQHPWNVMKSIEKFLGIKQWTDDFQATGPTGDYEEMNPEFRKHLSDITREYNQRLYDLINIDFEWEQLNEEKIQQQLREE